MNSQFEKNVQQISAINPESQQSQAATKKNQKSKSKYVLEHYHSHKIYE